MLDTKKVYLKYKIHREALLSRSFYQTAFMLKKTHTLRFSFNINSLLEGILTFTIDFSYYLNFAWIVLVFLLFYCSLIILCSHHVVL